jgi:hypothetical protein
MLPPPPPHFLNNAAESVRRLVYQAGVNAADKAEILSHFLENVGTGRTLLPEDPTLDPGKVLRDLRLPQELLNSLSTMLQALGFSWQEDTLEETFGDESWIVHRLTLTTASVSFLIHIPKSILDRNSPKDREAVDYIRHGFPSGARVWMISEGLDALKLAFKNIFETWENHGSILVRFIPWTNIQEMQASIANGITPGKRQIFLKQIFAVNLPTAGSTHIATFTLDENERTKLSEILRKQAKNAPQGFKGYFVQLLNSSRLPSNLQTERVAALSGTHADARALINWAIDMGTNPERKSHAVLAELIECMIDNVGLEDKTFLYGLVSQKPLIVDLEALDEFRSAHDLK